MAVASDILKAFNLFVDGVGHAGEAEEINLPNLAIVMDQFRAGGMDAPIDIDMGMEGLECSFTVGGASLTVLRQFGLAEGRTTPLTARGSLESLTGAKTPVVAVMNGKVKTIEQGAWKGGERAPITVTMGLRYYRYEQAGQVVHEIDVLNMIRIINGVDVMAEHRRNIGL